MGKLFGTIGMIGGGWVGWWLVSGSGLMTAFMVSTLFSGIGLYVGKKLAATIE